MDALPPGPQVNGRWRDALGRAAVAALLLLQYGLFLQFARREVVWAYPLNHDQIVYLGQSYDTYEQILSRGVWDGLKYGFYLRQPTGALLHLQAALLFLPLGASRLSALTLNFLHFALLQLVLVATLRWLTRRWAVALLGVGLLLAALAPFSEAGGMTDFRLDFPAFCLFGVFVCAVLRSRVLLSRRWAVAVGAAAAWLVLLRTLTLVYLTGTAALLGLFFLARLWHGRRNPEARRAAARRLTGLALAGAVLAAVAGPVLWDRRAQLTAYYVVGHLTGPERLLRAQKDGNPYLYYPYSLVTGHAGPAFLKLAALALLVGAAVRLARAARPPGAARLEMAPAFAFLAAAVAVPLAALTFDMHRSPCAGNVLLPGLLGLVLAGLVALAGLHRAGLGRPLLEGALAALAGVAVAGGVGTQLSNYGRHGRLTLCRYDVEQVLALHDAIYRRCQDCCWAAPVISATFNFDYAHHEAHRVLAYERHGTLPRTGEAFGGIFALSEADALRGARASDFLLVAATHPPPACPFDESLAAALPKVRAYCEAEMVLLGAFDVEGSAVELYARPALRVEGLAEGWVTGAGLRLTGPGAVLRGRPRVVLSGKTGPAAAFLGQAPGVHAELSAAGHPARTVPARFEVSPDRQDYRIVVDLSGEDVPADAPVEVRLAFEGGAVLSARGLRCNTRRLIVPAPRHTQALRD